MFRLVEVEIVVVLVPRNVCFVPRFLDLYRGVIDPNIGTDDICDRIQHLGMMDNPIRPLEQQKGFERSGKSRGFQVLASKASSSVRNQVISAAFRTGMEPRNLSRR